MRWGSTARAWAVLALTTTPALAADWLCAEVASQRSGREVRSCGVGLGADESAARNAALEAAKTEFNSLCNASSDCRGHAVNVQPERTTCEPTKDGGYKCYRLLIFSIGTEMAEDAPISAAPTSEEMLVAPRGTGAQRLLSEVTKAPEEKAAEPEKVIREEIAIAPAPAPAPRTWVPEAFDPTQQPKIKVGMTKEEAFKLFGRPDIVRENAYNVAVFYRLRPFCDGRACTFRFERDTGLVIQHTDFRSEYTDALSGTGKKSEVVLTGDDKVTK